MALQPCPNCGSKPKLHKKNNKFYYECDGDCWTQTDKYDTAEEAGNAWNDLKRCVQDQDAPDDE